MTKQVVLLMIAASLFGCASQSLDNSETSRALEQQETEVIKPNTADGMVQEALVDTTETTEVITQPQTFWDRYRDQLSLVNQHEHPRIERHLKWFEGNQTYFNRVMGRGQKYIYFILEQIEERNLPVELALLPIIESAYDPFAYSHSHASGLWQFIPSTAGLYGLKKDWWYDGRRDIVASTEAALNYLTYLHKLFEGDWLLALAAYNSGEGNVRRAIKRNRRQGKPEDFWSLKLPRETKAYVPQLLAVAKVFQNPEKFQINIPEVANTPFFTALELSGQIDLNKAAAMAGVTHKLLAELNPAFNRPVTHPEGPHRLLLPVENAKPFLTSLAALPLDYWQPNKTYQVKKGDSLYTIAKQHHVTIGQLKTLNNLSSNTLQIGQHLELPGFGSSKHVASAERPRATSVSYQVKQGDTLWDIAKQQKVSLKDLLHWNQLDGKTTLQPGQKLKLAENASAYQLRMKKVNYRVRRGDSLSRIASKFNLRINDILHWNSIGLQEYLKPGQRLTLFIDIRNI